MTTRTRSVTSNTTTMYSRLRTACISYELSAGKTVLFKYRMWLMRDQAPVWHSQWIARAFLDRILYRNECFVVFVSRFQMTGLYNDISRRKVIVLEPRHGRDGELVLHSLFSV